jgi:hypothetical protein
LFFSITIFKNPLPLCPVVSLEKGEAVRRWGKQERDAGVVAMYWEDPATEEYAWLARRNGAVSRIEIGVPLADTAAAAAAEPPVTAAAGSKRGRGAASAGKAAAEPAAPESAAAAAAAAAKAVPFDGAAEEIKFTFDTETYGDLVGMHRVDGGALVYGSRGGVVLDGKLYATLEGATADPLGSKSKTRPTGKVACRDVEVVRPFDSRAHLLAYGGLNSDLKVLDVATGKTTFRAKNIAPDRTGLPAAVWLRDVRFWHGDERQMVTITGHNQIRIYDARAQRRPVFSQRVEQREGQYLRTLPLGQLILTGREETHALMCDTAGDIFGFDLAARQLHGVFKGQAGSVRGMSLHPLAESDTAGPLARLASVGLGRHLVVHEPATRAVVASIYLKQRLNAVLFSCEGVVAPPKDPQADNDGAKKSKRA